MILINLLPPELRRRQTGVNPVWLSAGLSGVAALLAVGMYWYVCQVRLPLAETRKTEREDTLTKKRALADEVRRIEEQNKIIKDQVASLEEIFSNKQYWARTLDRFANLMTRDWQDTEYSARCTEITFGPSTKNQPASPRAARGTAPSSQFSFTARIRLVGNRIESSGDYINNFFKTLEGSEFWKAGSFVGKAEDTYQRDQPTWIADISRASVDLPLEFTAVKVAPPVSNVRGK